MAKKKFNTQAAIVIAVLVVLFLMFFRGGGLTAKFYGTSGTGSQAKAPGAVAQGNLPDLVPTAAVRGSYLNASDNAMYYTYKVTVKNQGTGSANAWFSVNIYDNMAGSLIAWCGINGLAAKATGSCTASALARATQLKVLVDAGNSITESDKSNNAGLY